MEFFAYENNALGFEPGQRLALKIKKIQDGENNVQSQSAISMLSPAWHWM